MREERVRVLKKYFIFLGVVIGLAVPISVGAEEKVLYCVEEDVTGFLRNEEGWKRTAFNPERFKIRLMDESFSAATIDGFEYTCVNET